MQEGKYIRVIKGEGLYGRIGRVVKVTDDKMDIYFSEDQTTLRMNKDEVELIN